MNTATRFTTLAAAIAAVIAPAYAASLHIPVTPANLPNQPLGFTVTASTSGKNVTYDITIDRKVMDPLRFSKFMNGELGVANMNGKNFSFDGMRPVKLKYNGRDQLRCRFTVTPQEVSHLCFQVGFPENPTVDNKRDWSASADFYCLELDDYAPRR